MDDKSLIRYERCRAAKHMGRLLISNQLTEETAEGDAALPADYLALLGLVSHRMIWLAEPGDLIVLPSRPDPQFCDYVWSVRQLAADSVQIVVPPAGRQGIDLLYSDRLANPEFRSQLSRLLAEQPVSEVLAFYVDADVCALVTDLGLAAAVPAFEFLTSGGADLVNSKSFFRTIALGNRVAVPAGQVTDDQAGAERFIWSLLAAGKWAIAKQDAHGGGYGNEILTTEAGVHGLGAASTVQLTSRSQLREHLSRSWDRYTYGGTRAVVIEHYLPGCVPIYIEFAVTDDEVRIVGYGEMRMKPVNNGVVVPPPSADLPAFGSFLASAQRLGEVFRSIGFRGRMGLDAIVTPEQEILFNESNGRLAGSTHVHHIGEEVIGGDYLADRVLIARSRCSWESVGAAVKILAEAGLQYAPATRTGVLLAGDDGQLLIVAPTPDQALELERSTVAALGLEDPT